MPKPIGLLIPVLSFALIAPAAVHGSTIGSFRAHAWGCDSPARMAPRHDTREARIAITTEDGAATLLLTHDVVAVQLSDHSFKRVMRELHDKEFDDDDIAFAVVIKHAVISTVRSVLDQSAECPIRAIREVTYRHGRLEFVTEKGRYVFGT
ncbi:MAG: hypothetical protein ACRDL7_14580, partial [Gaiellaceae bacterium]